MSHDHNDILSPVSAQRKSPRVKNTPFSGRECIMKCRSRWCNTRSDKTHRITQWRTRWFVFLRWFIQSDRPSVSPRDISAFRNVGNRRRPQRFTGMNYELICISTRPHETVYLSFGHQVSPSSWFTVNVLDIIQAVSHHRLWINEINSTIQKQMFDISQQQWKYESGVEEVYCDSVVPLHSCLQWYHWVQRGETMCQWPLSPPVFDPPERSRCRQTETGLDCGCSEPEQSKGRKRHRWRWAHHPAGSPSCDWTLEAVLPWYIMWQRSSCDSRWGDLRSHSRNVDDSSFYCLIVGELNCSTIGSQENAYEYIKMLN